MQAASFITPATSVLLNADALNSYGCWGWIKALTGMKLGLASQLNP